MFPKNLATFLFVSIATVAVSSAGFAQTDVEQESSAGAIEEVTVTAQRREQNLQDVPMSITAITGDSLRDQNITQADDLAKIIPNVSSLNVTGGGVPILIVRGVGLQNFRVNDSPTTAIFIDDVYQTSVVSANFSMFDLERVELLKGPQAGLYGRNTISGALQIISKLPEIGESADGYAYLEYGSYNRYQLEGAVSMPLSDTAALRIAARSDQSGDTMFTSTDGGWDHGESDRWNARALLRFAPNDNVDIVFKLHGGADNSEMPLMRPVPIFADLGTYPNDNVALASLTQTLCASILAGNGSSENCRHNTNLTNADYGLDDSSSNRFHSAADFGGYLDNSWSGASLNAAFVMGDYVLTSITAFDSVDYRRNTDLDGLPIEHTHTDYGTEIDGWSQEFRYAFTGSDTVNWVLGLNYAEDELVEDSYLRGSEGLLPVAFGGVYGLLQYYEQTTDALAVYGHGEWRFSDDWNLIAELRYTDVKKTFFGDETFVLPGGGTSPFLHADDEESFDDISGRIGLDWTASDNMLIYGSISRGFKTGGFFGGFATNPNQYEPYDSETIMAYELGMKSDWNEGRTRLNGAVFYYNRSDVQQSATDTRGTVAVTRLTNVGDVDVYGAEIDLTLSPIDGLRLMLGLGYTDSEIVDSDLVSGTLTGIPATSIEGTNTPNYSKFSANFMGLYEFPMGDNLHGRIQLEYNYQSDRDLNLVTDPREAALFNEGGYGLLNLRFGFGPESRQWEAMLFAENMTDESYRVLFRDNGLRGWTTLYGPERTWGASFIYRW